jgi:hypothetical protein
LAGDHTDLVDLHETIHYFGGENGPIPPNQSEFLLGLAYDVRHAYQGDRDKITMRTPNAKYTYFAVDVLWPIFLVQVAMLRTAASYLSTEKSHQANLYRLEACAENALDALDTKVSRECSRWLVEYSVFPANYLINFVPHQAYRYVFSSTTAKGRIRALPGIMREMSPYSEAYRAYEKELKVIAEKEKCRPEDLRDLSEWPEFRW